MATCPSCILSCEVLLEMHFVQQHFARLYTLEISCDILFSGWFSKWVAFYLCDVFSCDILSMWHLVMWRFIYVSYCPMTFCLKGIWFGDILYCGILSRWHFILRHFVFVAFCPVAFRLGDILPCDILSAWRFVLWHFVKWRSVLWHFVYKALTNWKPMFHIRHIFYACDKKSFLIIYRSIKSSTVLHRVLESFTSPWMCMWRLDYGWLKYYTEPENIKNRKFKVRWRSDLLMTI